MTHERNEASEIAIQRMEWEGAPLPKSVTPVNTRETVAAIQRMEWEGGVNFSGEPDKASLAELNTRVAKSVTLSAPDSSIDTGSPGDLGRRVRGEAISMALATASDRAKRAQGTQVGGFGTGALAARGRLRVR